MFIFSKKLSLFILLSIFAFFILAQPAGAVDQRCWKKTACESDNGKFFGPNSETNKACGMEVDASGAKIGFCTPGYTAETQVDFGGRKSFSGWGDFVKWIYQYGVMMAGILAVVMIINNGLKWVISGGSPEKISEAKKRIAQSLMGLFIVVLSYFILNAVNPYLVNMRLPQVWKINTIPIDVLSKYCINLPTNAKVVQVKGEKNLTEIGGAIEPYTEESPKDFWQTKFVVFGDKKDVTECGKFYAPIENKTENSVCRGSVCPEFYYCDIAKNKCVENVALTNISGGGIAGKIEWQGNKYLDKIWLKVMCTNGSVESIDSTGIFGLGSSIKSYKFEGVTAKGISECGGADNIEGYFFIVEANDDDTANTNDDQWAGGVSFCQSALSPVSCGLLGANGIDGSDIEDTYHSLPFIMTDSLFKHFYMEKGISCNFYLEEKSMPDIGTSILGYAAEDAIDTASLILLKINPKVDFGKEIYFMGKGYYCPYIEDRYDFFVKTIKAKKEKLKNK